MNIKNFSWKKFSGLPFLGLLGFLSLQGPLFFSDSGGYIVGSSMRSALYPLFLKITPSFNSVLGIQMGLGLYSVYHVINTLKKAFMFSKAPILIFCLAGILLMPYYGPTRFGNAILTEGLCYPFFLFFTSALLQFLYFEKPKYFYQGLFWTAVLILTRRQFLFLYPVLGGMLCYLFFLQKKTLKITSLVLWFCISILGTNLLERSYQYINDQHFKTIPFTGIQFMVAPLYVSVPQDEDLFSDQRLRALFQGIQVQLAQKKLLSKTDQSNQPVWISSFDRFKGGYNTISHGIVPDALSQSHYQLDAYQIDRLLIHMAWTLIKAHPQEYIILVSQNILYSLGGYFYSFLLALLFVVSFFYHLKYRDKLSMILFFAGLLTFGNYTLVALVEPVLRRYAIYTDTVQLSMILICFYRLFFQKKLQTIEPH